jgi:hypothetical protein
MTLLLKRVAPSWAALALLLTSCGKPGTPPRGQPAVAAFTAASRFASFVDRFNHAGLDRIQVVAMFSPT